MHSIHEVLEQIRRYSLDQRDKGARFERLMQNFLKTEPQYSQLYDEVWLWSEYPDRAGRVDTGIDLVARARLTGELTAIQCKFFDESTSVSKPMLDSFISASSKAKDGRNEFDSRLIISTSDNWGKNAEEAVANQHPPVSRLRLGDLDDSTIDWSSFKLDDSKLLHRKPRKSPFPHQVKAIADVVQGFKASDRGKLIMACGTGKTFTSLRIMEEMTASGSRVLFLVPSIALLSQSLKEWTADAKESFKAFAVCSDVTVGKRTNEEDIPLTDLAYPATTDTGKLLSALSRIGQDESVVIFSTYQSIGIVNEAQKLGLPPFDLVICDEAHRTTGVTLAAEDESAFQKIHDDSFIAAKKRLYMTATPRVFGEGAKSKASEVGAVVSDMNDEEVYGPEFHRLGFGEAVTIGRLTDYKVLVLAVDENYVSSRFQRLLADENNEMTLDDVAKIVGCWNGLSKRALVPDEFASDPAPMRKAVGFAANIRESKLIASMFEKVVNREIELALEFEGSNDDDLLRVEAEHVDGTFNILERNAKLDWLKSEAPQGTARLLTNARCLSEGVDVPALDAVMFLNPRDSIVDVVQSVGRVMRKLEGKNYGYVILPIAVPSDVEPSVALSDNKKYKMVWQVLQALRAHDERFDAEVNKIDLTGKTDRLQISLIGKGGSSGQEKDSNSSTNLELDFPELAIWRDAILAKIVDKVGDRGYWEKWATNIAEIAQAHITRITGMVGSSEGHLRKEFEHFLKGLQDNINPYVTEFEAIEMLAQHLITKPVFDALFEGYAFTENNPVSQTMQNMVKLLEEQNLEPERQQLDKFYDSVRMRASGIVDASAKQHIVKELYEKFFKLAFSGTSDRLGIVYTPLEIVDFLIHTVNDTLIREFGSSLSDANVHVLDPFTGTGTFIVRLIQSGLIEPDQLTRKFRYELHANEIVLLAYYVAAVNIEEAFHSQVKGEYVPFNGIVLTDTFQMQEPSDQFDNGKVFPDNNERVTRQKSLDIRVIVGNPPYRAAQKSANDSNQNLKYDHLDQRIADTYVSRSSTTTKTSMYDSYIRAIRWASDRVKDHGVVAFVTNNSFIDSKSADGFRASLREEFSTITIVNLRGNSNVGGDQAKREGGNVFPIRVGVALIVLAKKQGHTGLGELRYYETRDFMTSAEKLKVLSSAGSASQLGLEILQPNESNDWINQRDQDFAKFLPLANPSSKGKESEAIFTFFSNGVATKRDAWNWNYSKKKLKENVSRMVANYNQVVEEYRVHGGPISKYLADEKRISWVANLVKDLEKLRPLTFDEGSVTLGLYRPFSKQYVCVQKRLIWSAYRIHQAFPRQNSGPAIAITGEGSSVFGVLAVNLLTEYDFLPKARIFPLRFEDSQPLSADNSGLELFSGDSSRDGVSNWSLKLFEKEYQRKFTKEDIFHYVYGVLHHPYFQEKYASDLKKTFPRVPLLKNVETYIDAGRNLMKLHLNFETLETHGSLLIDMKQGGSLEVVKMKFGLKGRETDKSVIQVNENVTIQQVPLDAYRYRIGAKSAIEWVMDRYQIRTDKASGIRNDPNDRFSDTTTSDSVVDLISKIVSLSIESLNIIDTLPPFELKE